MNGPLWRLRWVQVRRPSFVPPSVRYGRRLGRLLWRLGFGRDVCRRFLRPPTENDIE